MNVELLKQLGNIGQIAGIRESRLLHGRGEGIAIAEFYNAAGLRFTVVPDRCMDLFDLSYKGVNLGFQSKNGLTSPQAFCPSDGEFSEQWPGGMLVTCGLGNVGGHATNGGPCPGAEFRHRDLLGRRAVSAACPRRGTPDEDVQPAPVHPPHH